MDISSRNIVIFDLETVGDSIEDFPEDIQNYLTKYADTEEKRLEVIEQLSHVFSGQSIYRFEFYDDLFVAGKIG